MNLIRTTLVAATSLLTIAGAVQAQSSGTTPRSEMQRGVPGVDVDAGRNAQGAVDVDRANTERARGVPGVDVDTGRNAQGAVDVDAGNSADRNSGSSADRSTSGDGMRAPRADRN